MTVLDASVIVSHFGVLSTAIATVGGVATFDDTLAKRAHGLKLQVLP